MCVCVCVCVCVLSSTDSFIVSQLFSVARHARFFKLGSKPAQLYFKLSNLTAQPTDDLRQLGNYYAFVLAFVRLHFLRYWIPDCAIR